MKKPLVSVVILNLNGRKLLKSFFDSIISQNYKNIEIIFVDNGSSDGSISYVRKGFPEVRVISNRKNLGFSKGCNQGASVAKGKYIYFLNNDARVEKNSLSKMISFLEKNKDVSLLGPFVYKKDGMNIESAGLYPTIFGFFYNPLPKGRKPFETFALTGAAMLVRSDWFKKAKGFDNDFFAYSEDIDLCMRIRKLGGKIYILPECKVVHYHGQTSKKMDKSFIVFHSTKNRILLLLKNFSFVLLTIILPIHCLFLLLMAIIFFISLKYNEAAAVLKGIFWNIKNLSSTMKKRKKIFKSKKESSWNLIVKHFRVFPLRVFFNIGIKYIKFW
ncbi:glycosyltransferase family 2 protein [Patescibacteria group bacterium]